jgi:hypothetical protein
MHFKLDKICAPLFDSDEYIVDLIITFDRLLDGSPNQNFASISVQLPRDEIEGLPIDRITVLAIGVARRELQGRAKML